MRDLESAWRRYFALLRQKCRRMLNDFGEADDVAQETFIRLWQAQLDESDPRAVSAWIYRTSTRLAVDRLRERRRRLVADMPAMPGAAAADAHLGARRELAALARSIPADELEIALLNRIDRLTQVEIGEVLGISQRTVRRRLEQLERRLRVLRAKETR